MAQVFLFILFAVTQACNEKNENADPATFLVTAPIKVQINGYDGNAMEPFISRDGSILLFNNLNAAPENTNIHWARKVNDSIFDYQGEVTGINTADLEGVPTLDKAGNLYFVSTRNYTSTLSTIYESNFANGSANNIELLSGISKLAPGWVNFDVEISEDGNTLYFVDGLFGQSPNPTKADIVIAQRDGNSFKRLTNSANIMKNVNTDALEYAAAISVNQLELYFTRVNLPITASSLPEIFVTRRTSANESFGIPKKLASVGQFVEAITIAPDQTTLYYHRKEGDKFQLFMVRKK